MTKSTTDKSKFSEALAKTKFKIYAPGDIVEAVVFYVTKNKIWVDVDKVGVGVIHGRELSADAPKLAVGEKIMATMVAPEDEEGNMVLSLKKADRERFWKELENKYESNETITVKVIDANKGGLMVESSGVSGFLPVSQLSYDHYPKVDDGDRRKILEKLQKLINKTLTVKILSFDKNRNNLIFSEKAAGDKIKEEAVAGLKVGDKIRGIVSGVIDFGVFVRFNNLEGLIHISEISWDRVENLKEMFKAGDEVEAEIISILGNKVSLSIKRLLPDKWAEQVDKYKEHQVIKGEVTRIVPFGVFVKINEVIDGLLHISDSDSKNVDELKKEFQVGKVYSFQLEKIDKTGHKISLKKIKE